MGQAPVSVPVALPWLGEEEAAAVREVLLSGWVAQGPRVAAFERAFAQVVGATEAVAVSSCTAALHLCLAALGIGPGDEVVVPSFSFIATANAVRHCGARPVFADIDPVSFNVSVETLERAVTPRTRAVIPVDQVGMPLDLEPILEWARGRRLHLVEDAACALGSRRDGRPCGSTALACFSTHPRKVITTGEGGMITTSDGEFAARLRRLRQHGMSVSDLERHRAGRVVFESYDEVGWNYRMTDLQAAVGLVQLGRLPEILARRRALAARYSQAFAEEPLLGIPQVPAGAEPNWQSYLLRVHPPARRDLLMARLQERGIATRRGIMAIHREAPYRTLYPDLRLPETEAASDETMILPLFPTMTEEQQDLVIESVLELVVLP